MVKIISDVQVNVFLVRSHDGPRRTKYHKWAYHFDFLDTGTYENSLTALHSQH